MSDVGFGIIGCGAIAPIHAESISKIKGARLVAVADVVERNAQSLADKYAAAAYTDYREMLARKDVHAVGLCVPSGMRAEIGEVCAAAGKHILAEKPLEVTTERIDRLIAAAGKAGVKLSCVYQSRFSDGALSIRKALDEGRFGKLVLGDAYIKWFRTQEYYNSGSWRGTRKLDGGGCLMNQGIHQIDLLLWFFGDVEQVYAQTRLVAHEHLEVEDLACAMLKFKSGALGVIEGSTAIWPGHSARIEVHGAEGGAVLEDGKLRFWRFKQETAEDKEIQEHLNDESILGSGAGDPLSNLRSDGHRLQITDFVEAIRLNRPPAIDGREGRRAVELIEAIYRSAASGAPVVFA
ncbi:MAG: Gfo/Idh/MocA family oxidoreductase [Candidatus Hydrogenedentes bacterium]|nr:Gfo/Idh/MocA family oxidoreductase [Candidatus Hydrogenedentota bacterium]